MNEIKKERRRREVENGFAKRVDASRGNT